MTPRGSKGDGWRAGICFHLQDDQAILSSNCAHRRHATRLTRRTASRFTVLSVPFNLLCDPMCFGNSAASHTPLGRKPGP